ncbi:MAG: aminotransferase class V-fold PLP-dependent enzyme [Jatrophihabitantaceae bacterium]
MHPVAREALLAATADGWADPGRRYGAARRARLLLDAARESLADSIGARPDEVSFAANGAQALHAAVLGTLAGSRGSGVGGAGVVHSAVEHSAVLHAIEMHCSRTGAAAVQIGVDALARVDTAIFVQAAARPGIGAAVLQAANHEVGTVQPVAEIAGRIAVPLVVDATQTLGHAELPGGWSVLAGDARTWGGADAGILAVRTGTRWRSPYPEDEHEAGRVPGVVNLPAVVAAAASLRAVRAEQATAAERHRALIERIRSTVAANVPDVEVLGDPHGRLPHIVTFSCLYVDGEALLTALDRRGFAVSSGSSCTSSTLQPSHVLLAMGALTSGNLRISLHHASTAADVAAFLAALPDVVAGARAELGAAGL